MLNWYEYNRALNAPGLAIKAGGSPLAKTSNTINYTIDGVMYTKAAADIGALTGINIADGYYSVLGVYVNTSGTLTVEDLTGDVLQATAVNFNNVTPGESAKTQAFLGYIKIATTGAAFTGGTTALDAGTVTATYIDAINTVF